MRLKLLRRRLTISAPRMAVRSALPWPLRWVLMAVVLGFCAAIALWAFELGKDLAGIDDGARDELVQLQGQVATLRAERDKARSQADTAASLLTMETAAQDKLAAQVRQLQDENRSLRDDLGFFERLIPSSGTPGVAVRGLQAELVTPQQLKWQVLVMQSARSPAEFNGRLELVLSGTQAGKPWTQALPAGPEALQLRQYRRIDGVVDLPAQVVVKNLTVRVLEGSAVRAVQSIRL
jgi:hypothetical protein